MSNADLSIPYEFDPGITHPLYLIRSNLVKALRKQIPELKGRMMDFGCGLKPYESLFQTDEYIGVDYQGEGETFSHHKVDVFYDGHTLPFPDNHFDSIFSSEVFEHIFNLPEIIRELHRVLKPGGMILVSCPFAFGEHETPADFGRYTSFAIQHIFRTSGFEVVHYEKTGTYHEALIQLKIVYWDKYILSLVKNIPVVRTIARWIIFGGNNLWAVIYKAIMPGKQDLYLNNVLLAKKMLP